MRVLVNKVTNVSVGDIIEFNHNGSNGECSFYLISESESEGYFMINFSGKKSSKIKYYKNIDNLIKYHKDCIRKIYSKKQWDINLVERR